MSDAVIRDFLDAVKRFDPKYYEDIGLVWFEVPTSEIKYVKYNNGWLEIKLKDTSEFRIDMLDFTYVYVTLRQWYESFKPPMPIEYFLSEDGDEDEYVGKACQGSCILG